MTYMANTYTERFPLLGPLTPGTTQRHEVRLPGAALADDRWPVISVTGAKPGPVLFVGAGVHGGEYPAIETVIRLAKTLDPATLTGAVVLMPVLNLPAFRARTPFVNPLDGVNPNRVFPGDPEGTHSEQLVHALTHEFIAHADAYIDLHGGDIVEDLVPFSIVRRGGEPVDDAAMALAHAFGLPYLLAVDRPVQAAKGVSSYVAAAAIGVPGLIAEAGGVGLLQPEAVTLLTAGVYRVLVHLGMLAAADAAPATPAPPVTVLKRFEWVYSTPGGMWYPTVAVNDAVKEGQPVGTIGSLYGDMLEEVTAPVSGRILFLTVNSSVAEHGLLLAVGASE